jgi:hypothetical protein
MAQGPTKHEHLMQQAGGAMDHAVKAIGQRIVEGGMAPQRAIFDFANSDEGRQFFMTGGGFQDLANIAKGLGPGDPVEGVKMGPGDVLKNPVTGAVIGDPVPVSEVQKFTALSEIAGLTAEERAEMARGNMLKDITGDLSAGESAAARLVKAGRISQETADLEAAGLLKIQPELDTAGKTIGYAIVDISNGSVTRLDDAPQTANGSLPDPSSSNYAEGKTPGSKPEELAGQNNGPIFTGMENPADIVDFAGPVGWATEKLGSLFGNVDASLAPSQTTQGRKALGSIMADANMLAKDARVLATEMNDLRDLSDTVKFATNPTTAADTLIALHDRYDNLEEQLTEMAEDDSENAAVRGNARITLSGIRKARANMPSREQLLAKKEQIASRAPMQQVNEAIIEGENRVGAVQDERAGKPQQQSQAGQPADYGNDMKRLRADWQSGKLTKGTTVIINGKPFAIGDDFKGKKE